MKYEATLVRGGTYILVPQNLTFKKGEPVVIDEPTFRHLTEHAVDAVSFQSSEGGEVETEKRAKFHFRKVQARVSGKVAEAEPEDDAGLDGEDDAPATGGDLRSSELEAPERPRIAVKKVAAKKAASRSARER